MNRSLHTSPHHGMKHLSSFHRLRLCLGAVGTVIAVLVMALSTGCDTIDNKRIPAVPVNIVFPTVATWDTYGVTGALDSRRFILTRTEREPRNFPFPATSATGFGGVLLACDYYGNPVAYDLACPVEQRADVRVAVNKDHVAECPVCHSTYAVFENPGHPLSGIAAERGYGLQVYHVQPGRADYMVITR